MNLMQNRMGVAPKKKKSQEGQEIMKIMPQYWDYDVSSLFQ